MLSSLSKSIKMTLLLGLILCGFYPLVVTGFAQILFKDKANGSLVIQNNQVRGSLLIGQNFANPKYFHGRPSAAGSGYDATSSAGTNLGPTSKKLIDNLNANIKKVMEENPGVTVDQIPVDLVSASASGLDPHISLAAAELQAPRVANSRNISLEKVRSIIHQHLEKPQWALFGEERVNVLSVNLTLDKK